MVDGLGPGGWGANVFPLPGVKLGGPTPTTGEEVAPVDDAPVARGPQRRDRSPQAALHAVQAARTAAEVAAAQFVHGLGPSGIGGNLPRISR